MIILFDVLIVYIFDVYNVLVYDEYLNVDVAAIYTNPIGITSGILLIYYIELMFRIYGYGKGNKQIHVNDLSKVSDKNDISLHHRRRTMSINNSNLDEVYSNRKRTLSVNYKDIKNRQRKDSNVKKMKNHVCGYLSRGIIEIIDFVIILLSLILTVVLILYLIEYNKSKTHYYLILSYETLRILRFIFRMIVKMKYAPKCVRLIVSVNRQRYFDSNFDLDICYIIYPRILVMSWPSHGIESLYRNPLTQVAKFLDTYHNNQYLIFDLWYVYIPIICYLQT